MTSSSRVLVIDQGGQSTRALLVTTDGVVERSARRSVSTHRSEPRVEQDAGEVLASVRECVEEVLSDPVPVGGVGIATQRSSLLAWDRDTMQPLSPVLSWQDRRASAELASLGLECAAIRATTGLHPSAHYGASKYQWLLQNDPRVARARDRGQLQLGPLSTYLVACLTEEQTCIVDEANAQRTLLWNLSTREFDSALLQTFGVPRDTLPTCTSCIGNHGTISTGAGRIPLVVVTGDQTAALCASGDVKRDVAYLNIGTGAFLQRSHRERAPDGLLTSVTATTAGERAWEGSVNGAAAAIATESRSLGLTEPEPCIDDWLRATAEVPLFLNGVSGLGSPYWDPNFRSRYVDDREHPASAKLVAVIESILFGIAVNLEIMERHGGRVNAVEATGGLARSDALLGRLAALIDRPVQRRQDPEATARGLAFLTSTAVLGHNPPDWLADPAEPVTAEGCAGLLERYARWQREIEVALRG